jgi:hypothetical protein
MEMLEQLTEEDNNVWSGTTKNNNWYG